MKKIEHNLQGNCQHVNACIVCGAENVCDVCHKHDEPRGECSQCPPCEACESEACA